MALPASIGNSIFSALGQQQRRGPRPALRQPLLPREYTGSGNIGPFAPPLDPTGFETYQMPGQLPGPGGIGTPYFNPPRDPIPDLPRLNDNYGPPRRRGGHVEELMGVPLQEMFRRLHEQTMMRRNPTLDMMRAADTRMLAVPFSPMSDLNQRSQGTGALMELISHLGLAGGGYGRGY